MHQKTVCQQIAARMLRGAHSTPPERFPDSIVGSGEGDPGQRRNTKGRQERQGGKVTFHMIHLFSHSQPWVPILQVGISQKR